MGESRVMTTAPTTRHVLSDEQLAELLQLVRKADSVELKLTVSEDAQRSAIQALRLDPLDAQIRQVFFFDTPDLALQEHGLVVRARRVQRKGEDAIVKLRPVAPDTVSDDLRADPLFNVAVDAMPGGFVCSGTLKGTVRPGGVLAHVHGDAPLRKVFTKAQRAFFAAHAPEGVTFDDLRVLGPIFVLKLKTAPADLDRLLVAELWLYPDGSRILELSTRCATTEAFQVATEMRVFLTGRG